MSTPELLAGITEDAVDFQPTTYNEERRGDPSVLPGASPKRCYRQRPRPGSPSAMATSIPLQKTRPSSCKAPYLLDYPGDQPRVSAHKGTA